MGFIYHSISLCKEIRMKKTELSGKELYKKYLDLVDLNDDYTITDEIFDYVIKSANKGYDKAKKTLFNFLFFVVHSVCLVLVSGWWWPYRIFPPLQFFGIIWEG